MARKIYLTEAQFKNFLNRAAAEDAKYNKVSLYNDPKLRSGKEWAEKGGNFAVMRNGRVYYISRSVAVSLYCFCKNQMGEWCVLANKRGSGAPNGKGLWNTPCGYLDYGESGEHAACREAWEETGVRVPESKLKMQGVNTKNFGGAQNVSIRYAAVLDGITDEYPLSAANCEPGEVDDIQWIPLTEISKYRWAFGQEHKIPGQAKTSLNYENGVIKNDLPSKINSLKNELKGNPYAEQLFSQILQDLKEYGML